MERSRQWILCYLLASLMVETVFAEPFRVTTLVETKYPFARKAVSNGLENVKKNGKELSWTFVELNDEPVDPQTLCNRILKVSPNLVINTVRTPGGNYYRLTTTIRQLLRNLSIPTLDLSYGFSDDYAMSGWADRSPEETTYLVHVSPPGDSYIQTIRDIIIQMDLPSVSFLYDDSVIIDHRYEHLLKNVPTQFVMLPIAPTLTDLHDKTVMMQSRDVYNFVTIGGHDHLDRSLQAIKEFDWKPRKNCWVLVTNEDYTPTCSDCEGYEIYFVHPADKDDRVRDYGPNQMNGLFYEDIVNHTLTSIFDNKNLPAAVESCAATNITSKGKKYNLLAALQSSKLKNQYGEIIFSDRDNKIGYQAIRMQVDHYKFQKKKDVNITQRGILLYRGESVRAHWEYSDPEAMQQFGSVSFFKIVTILRPPFVYNDSETYGASASGFQGYCIDMIDMLKKSLKFEYEIYQVDEFGSKDADGHWNGLIGEIVNKNADIGLGPISVLAERETVVDFTIPFYDLVGLTIIGRKPDTNPSMFKFLTVLEGNVWGCILGSYFFTSVLIAMFEHLSPYSNRNNKNRLNDDGTETRDFTLKECLWFCMTSLTPQGGGETPRNLSGRLVAATWWLFGFIIIASYSANLAAFLTISRFDSPIESLEDLTKQYRIKYAPGRNSQAETYFTRMANIEEKFYDVWKSMALDDSLTTDKRAELAVWDYPVSDKFTKLWWTMQEAKLPDSFEDGMDRVKQGRKSEQFALIGDAARIRYELLTSCDLRQIGSEFSQKPIAIAVQKNSTLRDLLSSAILKLLNQRKLERLKDKWWTNNPARKICVEEPPETEISIKNIGGIFIVISIGVCAALVTLVLEFIWFMTTVQRGKIWSLAMRALRRSNKKMRVTHRIAPPTIAR